MLLLHFSSRCLTGSLSDRIENTSEQLAGTYIDAQVLLLDPHGGIPDDKDLETYSKIQSLLIENHIDFQIADTDILENGYIKDGYLKMPIDQRENVKAVAMGYVGSLYQISR